MSTYERRLRIPAVAEKVFAWHEREGTLQKLIRPGDPVKLIEHTGGIRNGARVLLAVGYFPLQINWVALHEGYIEGRQFRDIQVTGPFEQWAHTHIVIPDSPDTCVLIDHVEYELPFGLIGKKLLEDAVHRKLDRMFDWRHWVTYNENVPLSGEAPPG